MYYKNIEIENFGPIRSLRYEFQFVNDRPKPLLVVGSNGAGKSIFLSHLVNPIMTAQQIAFDNAEVDVNKVFKLRSAGYVKYGETYSYSRVVFGDNFELKEWQLRTTRKEHDEKYGFPIIDRSYDSIPADEVSSFAINFAHKKTELTAQFNAGSVLYFPPNRFEEPAWLNIDNLKSKAKFKQRSSVQGFSNRQIIQERSLDKIKDWFLDVLLDRQLFEQHNIQFPINQTTEGGETTTQMLPINAGTKGPSTELWKAIGEIVKLVVRKTGKVRFGVGPRRSRNVALMIDEQEVVPNIFQLSTGQTSLLNIAFAIIRDFDMSGSTFTSLADLKGTVVIDEIDLHLHAELQCNVLPNLLTMFPHIQFIISTHSPLFLLGMKRLANEYGCDTISLPTGDPIDIEEFEEFSNAFDLYSESDHFRSKFHVLVEQSQKPSIFFEGDYDLRYVRKAADVLGKTAVLDKIELYDGDGFGNLNMIWKGCKTSIAVALPRVVGLIYDCDTEIQNADKDMVRKRVVPSQPEHIIEKGIENLFANRTITTLRNSHPQFFDVTPELTKIVRGVEVRMPEDCKINKQEKRNMCDYLCSEGTAEDFGKFSIVFDIIEEVIS